MTIQSITAANAQAARPGASGVIRKMEGILWYNMLSEMHRSGLDSSTLGIGADAYQNMFLWKIAQSDFGKYDGGLLSATLRQIGGRGSLPPAPSPVAGAVAPAAAADSGTDPMAETGGAVASAAQLVHATALTRSIWPAVQMAASILGVSPVGVLAQAALETGWGASLPGNNLFGIKAAAGQGATSRATHEMVDGTLVPETAAFRDYASPQACVTDYIRLIQSNFRGVVGQNTVAGFAAALQAGGFATDSNYASKIIMISRSPMMAQMLQDLRLGAGAGMPAASTTSD